MSDPALRNRLASEPDFLLGPLTVSPSTGRVFADGQEIRVEALTMGVLVALTQAAGATVSRDTLVEQCWQGRIVSDDAVARAIAKVRALERCTTPPPFVLETVPKIGYRLLADTLASPESLRATSVATGLTRSRPPVPLRPVPALLTAAVALGMVALIGAAAARSHSRPLEAPRHEDALAAFPVRSADFSDALLVLDEPRLKLYLQRGWDPNWKLDSEGNAALHNLMMVCERNRHHDQQGLLRVARLLVDAGGDPTTPNKWNDTPLIIAATPRYCGPGHPVVAYLKSVVASRNAKSAGR